MTSASSSIRVGEPFPLCLSFLSNADEQRRFWGWVHRCIRDGGESRLRTCPSSSLPGSPWPNQGVWKEDGGEGGNEDGEEPHTSEPG